MSDPTPNGPASLAPRIPNPLAYSGTFPTDAEPPTGAPADATQVASTASPADRSKDLTAGQIVRKERNEAKAVTRKDVTDLLASFAPEAPKTESAAEKERKRRVARWEANVRQMAAAAEEMGVTLGNVADAAATLKALMVVQRKGTAAIESLTDSRLAPGADLQPKAPRAPRGSRQSVPAPEKPAKDETPAVLVDPEPNDPILDTTNDESAHEVVAPAQHRGRPAPIKTDDPRGDTDPNAGDGF